MASYQRDVLGRFEVVRQLAFCELFKFAQNVRPPGMSFYDIIPIAPPSETAVIPTTTDICSDDKDDDDDKKRIIDYGEIEHWEMVDGGTGDVETVEDEGLLL